MIAHGIKLFTAIGSKGFPRDEEELRKMIEAGFDRAPNPAGTGRQLGAILKSGDRTKELRNIKAPTLVIHGTTDRLVQRSGGQATAAAIPGARLIDDRGHGPRPATRRVDADHRRDRGPGRALRRLAHRGLSSLVSI